MCSVFAELVFCFFLHEGHVKVVLGRPPTLVSCLKHASQTKWPHFVTTSFLPAAFTSPKSSEIRYYAHVE